MKSLKNRVSGPVIVFSVFLLLIAQIAPIFAQVETETYTSVNSPSGLIWTGRIFIFASAAEDMTKLYAIDPIDKSIQRFGPTFASPGDVRFVSSSGINFPAGHIYATSGDKVYEITSEGDTVRVFATPASGVAVVDIAFDIRGYWNDRLIAVTEDGGVWVVDKNGGLEKVADLGASVSPSGVTVARDEYGEFSGHILVLDDNGDRVLAISHIDHSVSTLAELPEGTPRQILYTQTRSDIYLAEQDAGVIAKIDRDLVGDYLAQMMVVTEAPDNTITLTAVKSARAGVEVATIATGLDPDMKGFNFVLDSELAEAMVEQEEEVVINPLLIIIPVFVAVVIVTAVVIWRYRGF